MIEHSKTCNVCWALIAERHMEDHLRWHKNLSNRPAMIK